MDKISKIRRLQALLIALLAILIMLTIWNVYLIQGTARVINYAGIARGATQRLVKLEIAGFKSIELQDQLDVIMEELREGGDENNLICLDDENFQNCLKQQSEYWIVLRNQLQRVRQNSVTQSDIIRVSEEYFRLADLTVAAAEEYSERIAKRISITETGMIIAIYMLIMLSIALYLFSAKLARENEQYLENERKIKEELRLASLSKSEFLSKMSHDIRTPMNAIVGMTELAELHSDEPEKVLECIYKIKTEGEHLKELVNNVLDISRIESGKVVVSEEPTCIDDIMDQLNVSMQSLVGFKSISYSCDSHDIISKWVNVDSLKLTQVYLNLLSNAIKYTPDGGRVHFDLWQEAAADPGKVIIAAIVRDTGIGMSPEVMESMYSAFTRAVDTRINRIEGSGLGLAIVKQLTDLMGGTIEADSKPGFGTTFVVRIMAEIIDEPAAAHAATDENPGEKLNGKEILIVEDNDINYVIAREILTAHGAKVRWAKNGRIAVDKICDNDPGTFDLILMDMQMPVMNGVTATKSIRMLGREDTNRIPIIAMTANAFEEDKKICFDAGMNDHIAKPVDAELFVETLAKALS